MKRWIKLSVSLAYFACDRACRLALALLGRPLPPKFTIIYYHAVPAHHRAAFSNQMDILLRRARVVPASHRDPLTAGGNHVAITFDDAFASVAANALPELIKRSFHATIFVPAGWLGRHPGWLMEDDANDRGEIVMTAEQLKALPSACVALGAHSVTHRPLASICREMAKLEVMQARSQLEALIGRPVDLFAFPYGSYDAAVIDLCREAGYEYVFSIEPQSINPTRSNLVRGRTKAELSDSSLEFFLKSQGAYCWMSLASLLKHRLSSTFSFRTAST